MNEKEIQLEAAKLAESFCLSSSISSDSFLPKYSENTYSHLDDMEKGCLCLHSDPAPPYPENNHQEASVDMARQSRYFESSRNFFMSILWLIFWPAKIARIPEARRRQENEALRLGWCFIGSIVLDFFFSYFFLVPFIKESMKEFVGLRFQIALAIVLVIAAFYMFLFVFSLLLDFIALVLSGIASLISGIASWIPWIASWISWIASGIASWIIAALGFRMSSERNDSTDGNWIPLNTMPAGSENQSNNRSDNTAGQPSSECFEQHPRTHHKPSQARDAESTGNESHA
ncbi:hypothetical protein SPOG_05743 [Schizosaccharomyces cryophilus OY26]|uniref:Uncharacterized protein n=1 Tax=Schizosaccharomyces cryophilus (strain OY26 / ATCC MYA-4695 / CBS 11777 / NBRC 106824 / NRRL Y48691) TaxID=653667 RepID=S9XEU6_SCHCR|nr:uncharacterized protein SPOG_05743 [Schizosaccharomyces cryophilus OY26]EPY52296.1 hypothetical protein SPOG_05743 [Schizosaccharomyces cryophilus OY26]